jgi:predicted MFS family arabinose efflux permease
MRGHRPSALNVIEATGQAVTITAWGFADGTFVPGPMTGRLDRERGLASQR